MSIYIGLKGMNAYCVCSVCAVRSSSDVVVVIVVAVVLAALDLVLLVVVVVVDVDHDVGCGRLCTQL